MAQADALARRLSGMSLAAVVTSPLSRCVATARALGAPVVVEPDLVECDFGEWEGLTFAEVRERWPAEHEAWSGSVNVAPPGGESFDAVTARVRRALGKIRTDHRGETVALVSHVSPIKLLLRDALAATDTFLYRLYLDPAGLSIVDSYADGGVAVRTVNDTAHLIGS